MMHHMGSHAMAEAYRRPGLVRAPSRAAMDDDDGSKARVRVYRFGEHIKGGQAGSGVLAVVPTGERTEMDLVRGMLLRAAYGDTVDFEFVDYSNVYVYLLPDGEEITQAGECGGEGEGEEGEDRRGQRRREGHGDGIEGTGTPRD